MLNKSSSVFPLLSSFSIIKVPRNIA
jgi:hypothetical protein